MTRSPLASLSLALKDDPLSPFDLRRTLERQRIGRAYGLAQEIAPWCSGAKRLLDVGCGSGYVAYHLGATLGCPVLGVDVTPQTQAPIAYQQFDGCTLPFADGSFDAATCTFVLHHSQDAPALLTEMARVLSDKGTLVLYEDLPDTSWDRWFCRRHDERWRSRTGPCTFRSADEWATLCERSGFSLRSCVKISRLRDFTHPVRRCQIIAEGRPASRV